MIKDNILMVGCGRMGGALLAGLIDKVFSTDQLIVMEADEEAARHVRAKYGVKVCVAEEYLPEDFRIDTVIFAVKPQVLGQLVDRFATLCPKETLFISIAAGKTISFFEKHLGPERYIIRTMPNLPAVIGQGVTVLCANKAATRDHIKRAERLFSAVGQSFCLEDEALLDAVTAVSGSGPAYVFHFIEAMTDAAVNLGLPKNLANNLVYSTLCGSAQLAADSKCSAAELREQVTSPNGTTQAALEVLMGVPSLTELLTQTVEAAKERSKELAD